MSNLVLFTNRSGSTILADLLAYQDGSINLGEGLHSIARDYNYNKAGNKDTDLYREFSESSLTRDHHNISTRGSNHIGFFRAKAQRIQLLKDTRYQWTVKENLEKLTIDVPFIQYCCSNYVDVYITYRYDIVAQFISNINARYRSEILKLDNGGQFIYTNNDIQTPYQQYGEMRIKFHWLHMYVNVFLEQLMMWRIIYEKFKQHIKVINYEDEIQPMNFHDYISNDTVVWYKQEKQHLVQTPYNTDIVVVEDDHTKPIIGAWQQALYYIKRHQYLVEI